jgi:hypothetical protein
MTGTELKELLSGYYCTENYYQHFLLRNFVYTDGVKAMAEAGSAYWLIDAIASHQKKAQKIGYFQLWELKKQVDGTWLLTCREDSGMKPVVSQKIEYSDFPMNEIKLYVEGDGSRYVLLLPSEH